MCPVHNNAPSVGSLPPKYLLVDPDGLQQAFVDMDTTARTLSQVAEMESLRMQLQSLEDKCAAKSSEISRLRDEHAEVGEEQ